MNYNSLLKYLSIAGSVGILLSVNAAFADLQQLVNPTPLVTSIPAPTPTVLPITKSWPIGCYDFTTSLKMGMKGIAVRHLQYFLIKEGFDVPQQEFGAFDNATFSAVSAFQQKYASEILVPAGLTQGNGYVGKGTRAKLNSLYSCDVLPMTQVIQSYMLSVAPAPSPTSPSPVLPARLEVTNTTLDNNGATITFCNKGSVNLLTAPLRIRLKGINRDFEDPSVQKPGVCDTNSIPYGTWGLSYDPGATYTAVTIIDPNGYYKTSNAQFSINATTTLSVPIIPGAHLSVRSVLIKTTGVQATLCNFGSNDLTIFPVRVIVNGTSKDFDVSAAYKKGVCTAANWTYDNWGISYTPKTSYNVIVQVDPNNVINEINEFDNTAIAVGTP